MTSTVRQFTSKENLLIVAVAAAFLAAVVGGSWLLERGFHADSGSVAQEYTHPGMEN